MKIQRLTQCIFLAAASLVLSGAAFAADKPAQLSDTQLDNVTAGSVINGNIAQAVQARQGPAQAQGTNNRAVIRRAVVRTSVRWF